MFSCTDICYTSQIKLFETTNVIETHIAQKYFAQLGMMEPQFMEYKTQLVI